PPVAARVDRIGARLDLASVQRSSRNEGAARRRVERHAQRAHLAQLHERPPGERRVVSHAVARAGAPPEALRARQFELAFAHAISGAGCVARRATLVALGAQRGPEPWAPQPRLAAAPG